MAATKKRWSQHVTETSDALDIAGGTFASDDPKAIARELKRDAESSHRRKSSPYRSAMSMLTFFINRAGRGLPAARRKILEQAKDELRREFGVEPKPSKATASRKTAARRKKSGTRAASGTRKATATRKPSGTRKKAAAGRKP